MRKRILASISLGFFLGILVILFWRELIRELILLPFSYLVWISGLLYRSFDQQTLWIALLIFVTILAWLSLKLRYSFSRMSDDFDDDLPNRVQVWSKRLGDIDRGAYLQWRLAQHISHLLLEAISCRAGLSPDQVADKIADAEFELPEQVRAYLVAARGFQSPNSMSRGMFSSTVPQPLDCPPEEMTAFIESYIGFK